MQAARIKNIGLSGQVLAPAFESVAASPATRQSPFRGLRREWSLLLRLESQRLTAMKLVGLGG
jgi:hypothetical protein